MAIDGHAHFTGSLPLPFVEHMAISAHYGENSYEFTLDQHLGAFEKLAASSIDRFCHATVLWLPSSRLTSTPAQDKERLKCLELMGNSRKTLEICPTANLIMTPMADYRDIPLNTFKELDINFTINTDNKTFFQTNLTLEKQRLGLV